MRHTADRDMVKLVKSRENPWENTQDKSVTTNY